MIWREMGNLLSLIWQRNLGTNPVQAAVVCLRIEAYGRSEFINTF